MKSSNMAGKQLRLQRPDLKAGSVAFGIGPLADGDLLRDVDAVHVLLQRPVPEAACTPFLVHNDRSGWRCHAV